MSIKDYTSKDYESFRAMMIEELKKSLPEYTDTSQTDAGIVIIELLAKGLDILSYYQDVIANETLLPTVELRSNALKWCSLLGYTPVEAIPSKCKQIFIKGEPSVDVTIPKGTQVMTSDNVIFETVKDLYIPSEYKGDEVDSEGNYRFSVDVVQGYTIKEEFVSYGDGSENQTYTSLYAPALINAVEVGDEMFGEMELKVNDKIWNRVDSFVEASKEDYVYTAYINENGNILITFGSKLLGSIPTPDDRIEITYRVGGGEMGNVAKNTIKTLVTSVENINSTTNITAPEGENRGFEQESLESIKSNAPRSFMTLDRAVTLEDHTNLIRLNPDFSVVKSAKTYQKEKTPIEPVLPDCVSMGSYSLNSTTVSSTTARYANIKFKVKSVTSSNVALRSDSTITFKVDRPCSITLSVTSTGVRVVGDNGFDKSANAGSVKLSLTEGEYTISGLKSDANTYISELVFIAEGEFNWKDTVQIYVQYEYGVEVDPSFLFTIRDFIKSKQIIGTFAEVYLAQPQEFRITATLIVDDSYNEFSVEREVKDATYWYASRSSLNVGETFSIVDYEKFIIENVEGVKYYRVNYPNNLVLTPNRGCYLQLPDTEDEDEKNPNLTINIAHE